MRVHLLVLAGLVLAAPSAAALLDVAPATGLTDPAEHAVEAVPSVADAALSQASRSAAQVESVVEANAPAAPVALEEPLVLREQAAAASPPAAGARDSAGAAGLYASDASTGLSLAFVAAWLAGAFQWISSALGLGALPKWLRGLPWTGGFSRIRDDELLDSPTRRRIHEAVSANPGITMTQLRSRLGLAWGTTVRHLRRLEARGLVSSTRGAAGRQLFAAHTGASRDRELWSAIAHPTAARIARFVDAHPGTHQKDLCAALGLRNPAASKHLTRFQRLGLVESRYEARHRLYAPTARLGALLAATPA